jgi:hypothetical protein
MFYNTYKLPGKGVGYWYTREYRPFKLVYIYIYNTTFNVTRV